jgi:hypothetical protein
MKKKFFPKKIPKKIIKKNLKFEKKNSKINLENSFSTIDTKNSETSKKENTKNIKNKKKYFSKTFLTNSDYYKGLSMNEKIYEMNNLHNTSKKRFKTYYGIFEQIKNEINDIQKNLIFSQTNIKKKKYKSLTHLNSHFKSKQKFLMDIEEKEEEYFISPEKKNENNNENNENENNFDFYDNNNQIINLISKFDEEDFNNILNNKNNENKENNENDFFNKVNENFNKNTNNNSDEFESEFCDYNLTDINENKNKIFISLTENESMENCRTRNKILMDKFYINKSKTTFVKEDDNFYNNNTNFKNNCGCFCQ